MDMLLLAFDQAYLGPGMVALSTALKNSPTDMPVIVGTHGLSEASENGLRSLDGDRVRLVNMTDVLRSADLHSTEKHPAVAYTRMFISRIVPADTRRVVYLDADTLTRKPLDELFAWDLRGKVVGACVDERIPTHGQRGDDFYSLAGSLPSTSYFNSGVLVIDVEKWRSINVETRVLEIAETNTTLRYLDQDPLNLTLWNLWYPLEGHIWNFQPRDRVVGTADASIVHFTGQRPWKEQISNTVLQREYRRVAREVGWDYRLPARSRLRAIIRRAMPAGYIERRQSRRKHPPGIETPPVSPIRQP